MAGDGAVNGEGDDAWLIQIDNPCGSQLRLDQGTIKRRLHQAILKGNWKTAKHIFEDHPLLIGAEITGLGETPLHVATSAGNTGFVRKLMHLVDDYQLTYRDHESNTAFFHAASNGAKEIAEVMIAKEPDLPYLRGRGNLLPIHMAASRGQREMVKLLHKNTDLGLLEQDDRIYLLVSLIKSDMFAIAMDMINDGGGEGLLVLTDRDGETVLSAVARKSQMLSNSRSSIFSCSTDVQVKKASELLDPICKKLDESQMTTLVGDGWDMAFFAAEKGNVEFLRALIDHYPDLLTRTNKDGHTIFDLAVLHRRKKNFELIGKTESSKKYVETLVASGENYMLQLAAQLAPSNRLACIPGEVLQLQHELLWFKEVQRLVAPQAAQERNLRDNQQTPNDMLLFIQNHQELIKKAEAWLRRLVNPYMIGATLFSAGAYMVPGGTNQNTGYPMFLPDISYKIFAVAQAISFVSSVTSALTFMSLPMSTYSPQNFVREIPLKLLLGLSALFLSISSLMVGFVAEIFMYFKQRNLYIKYLVPMALFFCLPPPFIFFWLHKGLVFAIIKSTPFTLNHKISTPGAILPHYSDDQVAEDSQGIRVWLLRHITEKFGWYFQRISRMVWLSFGKLFKLLFG